MSNRWLELEQKTNVMYMMVFILQPDSDSPGAHCLTMYGLTKKSLSYILDLGWTVY